MYKIMQKISEGLNELEYKDLTKGDLIYLLEERDKEIEILKKRLEEAQLAYLAVNERNVKAIEYIEGGIKYKKSGGYCELSGNQLLRILKGSDKE